MILLTLKQLLAANTHVGYAYNFFNVKLKGSIIGLRKKLVILNINITILQLQIITNLITNVISKRHYIFIVKNNNFVVFMKNMKNLLFRNVFIWEKKWIGGMLTNFKKVYLTNRRKFFFKKIKKSRRFPSLILFFDLNFSKSALVEASNLDIPIVSLINSDTFSSELVNYPIVSNNRGVAAILLYIKIISNSIIRGKQKELECILSSRKQLSKISTQKIKKYLKDSKIKILNQEKKYIYKIKYE